MGSGPIIHREAKAKAREIVIGQVDEQLVRNTIRKRMIQCRGCPLYCGEALTLARLLGGWQKGKGGWQRRGYKRVEGPQAQVREGEDREESKAKGIAAKCTAARGQLEAALKRQER